MIVQCSWKVSDDRPVLDAVTWSEVQESADVEDEVRAENCLMLEAPYTGEGAYPTVPACQLLLSTMLPNQISHISVLCEARVMEVYGHHGEYLKTVRNELLEAADDMVVFRGDIELEKPLALCSIKFACLRSPTEMWLYGIKVTTAQAETSAENHTMIPLEAVEQRLSEMGLALSDKAEAFKQLVERCQKSPMFAKQDIGYIIANLQLANLVKNISPSPQAMGESLNADFLHGMSLGQLRDSQNNLTEDAMKLVIGHKHEAVPKSPGVSVSPENVERIGNSTQTEEEYVGLEEHIKTFINDKIEDLDKALMEKINRRFQEFEAKIMCKLDEIESFVKPQGIAPS